MSDIQGTKLSPRAKIAGAFGLGFGFFAGAGVTGLSMLIGLLGIWGWIAGLRRPDMALTRKLGQSLRSNWLLWILFFGFFGWVMITALWSPATELAGESVRRIAAMLILAPVAVWACASSARHESEIFHRAIMAGLGVACFVLMFECVSGASMNRLASPEKDPLAIAGDLGRAATATLALFWAGYACLVAKGVPQGVKISFVVVCLFLSFQFGTDLNALGLVVASLMALLALKMPRFSLGVLSGGTAMVLLTAPLLYPYLATLATRLAPNGELPLSYARRAQMWEVASDLIAQKPVMGWGVGAGSTFDRTISYGGYDWPLIQLHPAPLHIWLETGAIGALLASLAIVVGGAKAAHLFQHQKTAAAVLVGGTTFLIIQWSLSHAAWREWMWTSFAIVLASALSFCVARPERKKESTAVKATAA
jgi:O-antigen ligase